MKWVIGAYLVGLLYYYTLYSIPHSWVDNTYYLWDKSVGGGFIWWFIAREIAIEHKFQAKVVFYFSLLRFVWEIISVITGIQASSEKSVAISFVVVVFIIGIMCVSPKSRFCKFVDRKMP